MMEVVEADDTPVHGPNVTHVQIGPAQRYSVIVNTDQGKAVLILVCDLVIWMVLLTIRLSRG
jgi:FtsP/CotA-like multicopper oxidase with cupredoxin domain